MASKTPTVSVCMPVYNAAPYLNECIDSILAQTYKDFELLIVDDGSTDDSVDIVKSYSDPRIRLILNEHDYIGSLNIGLNEARGKYIARMDADDVMMQDRLQLQYAYMEAHPEIDILGGAMLYAENTKENIIYYYDRPVTVGDLLSGTVLSPPTVMMRAKSITSLRYDRKFIYAEDYHFWCQALKIGLKMMSLKDVLIKNSFVGANANCNHATEQHAAVLRAKTDLQEWLTVAEARHAYPANTPLPASNKPLTVIITFLNEGIELERTVAGIRHTVGNAVDIIVINDCSFDGYPYGKHIIPFNVHYIVNRHRLGVAASRDLGIRLCQTPYFLLLDAHMRFYDNRWADRIIEELNIDERQLLCCQGRILYKEKETGKIKEEKGTSTTFGAYFPFQKDSIWPDITWNYKEKCPSRHTESIPVVLGAAYATSKSYWQRIRGLEGLHNYGADEQYISLKVWLEGGRCTLLKDVVIGHIYRKQAPYPILGRDSIYNLLFIAKLLFPQAIYSKSVATAISHYKEYANEALCAFDTHKEEIHELKKYLQNIFVRTTESLLPMHQACRNYNIDIIQRLERMLPNIASHLQEHWPTDDGLMEGKTGVLLWLCHYEIWTSDAHINKTAIALYSIIETHVKEQRLPWNFRYGLSGIGWGILYLYAKGFINLRPDELIDQIDEQLRGINPESIKDVGLDTGASGILAYLTLRLTIGRTKPILPLKQWYEKAKTILSTDGRQEVIYYAHLFCSIYEEGAEQIQPLIGIWLSTPSHLPQNITDSHYTLADGLLGTTLQTMLLLQNSKTEQPK
ncbi:MAG: glycosyltransferase [Paraprevotella sp.]|nr:glycosyltransferase [Paraprevotella sp.]